ncbi:NAD(P)-dependent oxidoreductase [Kineosporia sp. R_H_3]|uniref:NAD(P)-dependent oxidoreductase n=1 Tax=Kineosporia sp. R_H_3 TaxID=1961848 RepID=UPI001304032E|nr:NAD(P)H-binding protein [Kineosporia sp. R_H_3]
MAVLEATGATGRHVVAGALRSGHRVVAVVRRAGSFAATAGLREVVWADIADEPTLTVALNGAGVVISTLGGAGKGPTTVCTDAVRTAIRAMATARVTRLIAVSAHGVLETHDRSLYSMAARSGVGERMKDKETMEPLIVGSSLDWTIVRPPRLRNTPATGTYRVGEDLPIKLWHFIGREDLATFLVREADEDRYTHRYPRIRR